MNNRSMIQSMPMLDRRTMRSAWVELRRGGWALAALAEVTGFHESTISQHTAKPLGTKQRCTGQDLRNRKVAIRKLIFAGWDIAVLSEVTGLSFATVWKNFRAGRHLTIAA